MVYLPFKEMKINSRAGNLCGSSFLQKVAIGVSLMIFQPAGAQLCSQDPVCSKTLSPVPSPVSKPLTSPVVPNYLTLNPSKDVMPSDNVGQSYIPTQILANQLYRFANSPHAKNVVENLFVLPAWSYEPGDEMSAKERERFKESSKEAYNSPASYVVARRLIANATRVYMNQTVYNWLYLRRKFFGENLDDVHRHPKFDSAYQYVSRIADTRKISMMDETEWKNQINWFNEDLASVQGLCESYRLEDKIIQEKHDKYKKSRDQFGFDMKNHPDLLNVIYPQGQDPYMITASYDSLFNKRRNENMFKAAEDSSMRRFILSNSIFGMLYDGDTTLHDFVGDFDPLRCSNGIELNQIEELTHDREIFETVAEKEELYKKTVAELIENLENDDFYEVLVKYIQENPTSIQLALLYEPDPQAVYLLSGVLLEKQRREVIRQARNVGIGILTLPLVWVKGIVAARLVFMMSTYYAISTVRDIRTTYQMEDRIKQSLASGQISKERGYAIIETIHDQRPYSYLNLALAGLSVAASGMRVRELGNMKAYVDATTQGGAQMGSKAAMNMMARSSGANAIHHPIYASSADDLGKDLAQNALAEALSGKQVTDEAAYILSTGGSVRPPIPRLPSTSADNLFDRVKGPGGGSSLATPRTIVSERPAFAVTNVAQSVRAVQVAELSMTKPTGVTMSMPMRHQTMSMVAQREKIQPMKLIQPVLAVAEMVREPIQAPLTATSNSNLEELWKKIGLHPYTSTWHLLQEALNGHFTLDHVRALLEAKSQCARKDTNLSDELCASVDMKLMPSSALRRNIMPFPNNYGFLKGFSVEPKAFMKWWRDLNFIKVNGVVVKNPFTEDEMQQINTAFDLEVLSSIEKGDPIAKGSIAHMDEHMRHAELYTDYIQSMGIDIKYYKLLVHLHDAGKFIPSQRVLDEAKGNFLMGRIMWHDQSTADYLLDLGERLGIDSAKIEHLIADIVGHNDGSGLKGIFWTTFFPHYGMPRRLEGDILTIFDRYGQGNWIGARKIAPSSVKEGFFGKVNDAYYISPGNTIRQLDAIYQRALSRLKLRHASYETMDNLKQMHEYAVAAQRKTMLGYERLKWSDDRTSCSVTVNGESKTANDLKEFLEDPFQNALQTEPN